MKFTSFRKTKLACKNHRFREKIKQKAISQTKASLGSSWFFIDVVVLWNLDYND
jgi:hypothetical protein